MAKRDLIKKENNKAYEPDSQEYKMLIKELIRLDVPILEVGSSSIGKSYSIRQFMEEAGIKGEFLFVGTEKSEFIEGIPNLKGITGDAAKFSYLKPYWFPDKEKIRARLKNGKAQIESLAGSNATIADYWVKAKIDYSYVEQLCQALLSYKRTDTDLKAVKKAGEEKPGKFVYEDALLYLSTVQGYGNFWLILDEIDKVEKQDKDKYAPLLHIVRERELKGWKLSGLREYPEYDIKFVETITTRFDRIDAAILNPDVDVTDTRIIAIANDLQTMEEESPALYRRFVKVIIRSSLYDAREAKGATGDQTIAVGFDWAKQFEIKRQQIHDCIVIKEVSAGDEPDQGGQGQKRFGVKKASKTNTIGSKMAEIEEEKVGKSLDEMNLQWTLGFLPEILFPGVDTRGQGEVFVKNLIIENFNDVDDPYRTLLFKIIQDNFQVDYWIPLLECIYGKISIKQAEPNKANEMGMGVDEFYSDAGLKPANFNSPDVKAVETMLDRYSKKLVITESKYQESLETQIKIQKGEMVSDKKLTGLEGGIAVAGNDVIVFGSLLIEKSLINKKPTELTRLLVSSVPFMQVRFIESSPYVAYNGAKDLMAVHDSRLVYLVELITGKSFKNEAEAKEATSSVFGMIEPYRPFIVKYGIGAPADLQQSIVDGEYKKITDVQGAIRSIIANKPVIIDSNIAGLLSVSGEDDKALKKEYYESISSVKMIEKEIYTNLTDAVWPMIINTVKNEGYGALTQKEVTEYCNKFPNTMRLLGDSIKGSDASSDLLKKDIAQLTSNPSTGGLPHWGRSNPSIIDTIHKFSNGGALAANGYYVIDVKSGDIVSKGFDTEEEAKVEMYKISEETGNKFLATKKGAV
jgi:hypothetical protein